MTPKKKPPTPRKLLNTLLNLLPVVAQECKELLDDDGRFALNHLLAQLDNPAEAMEEPTDALERWALRRKDPDAFCPSLVLWADWLAWCRHTGERPGTRTTFYARLRIKSWLRKGRTKVDGTPRNGWWGLKL